MKLRAPLFCMAVGFAILTAELRGEETATVQEFESDFELVKYPGETAGNVSFSTEWKAAGKRSLRIDAGLMTALQTLMLKDWTGYTALRVRVNNPTGQTVLVGFELADQHGHYHERHQNGFGVQPGESTIELDFSGGLWRGEENKPYIGKIKTPINTKAISRVSFTNTGTGPVYFDSVEVVKVKKLETPGGFAFDFVRAGGQVMNQFLGVAHTAAYDAKRGYGNLGGPASSLSKNMSFPTPMLGAGIAWEDGFRVDLPEGGKYIGWIAFERGGFWEDEHCGYTRATLKNNGAVVHQHAFTPAGPHFQFQDTEITDMAQVAEKIIWPAQAIHRFTFDAAPGGNSFSLETTDAAKLRLRVAGLIVAPHNAEGEAYIQAHEDLQKKVIATTFAAQNRARRAPERAEPAKDLVCEPLPIGDVVFPGDWPRQASGAMPRDIQAVAGQMITIHLGLYAKKNGSVAVTGESAKGPAEIAAPQISYGCYMPQRPYGVGAVWLEVSHYRPEHKFSIGPDLCRSVVIEYDVPADAKPGAYSSAVQITSDAGTITVPLKFTLASVVLPEIPIPVGVFKNSLSFEKKDCDEATWWRLQESLLKEEIRAGLNALSGGPDLEYRIEGNEIKGENAIRYIKLAQKYGTIRAIVPYGGFLPRASDLGPRMKDLAPKLKAFEEANGLPPTFVYSYDEPTTEEQRLAVMKHLVPATESGLKTIGYTSSHFNDPQWVKMMESTYAPAVNIHTAEDIKKIKAAGKHPWVYNNGRDRYGFGIHLWREIQLGVEGRMDWIGVFTQGFAFNNLDGREPSYPCFLIHKERGVLKTASWLSGREGLLDLRIRLALEKFAPKDDPVLKLWSVDGYKTEVDQKKWSDVELDTTRAAMIKRLGELNAKP